MMRSSHKHCIYLNYLAGVWPICVLTICNTITHFIEGRGEEILGLHYPI